MPKVETIKASDAPAPPKKVSKMAGELLEALNRLQKDEVIKLTPDEGKSVRGVKTSVGRVASNQGIKLTSWDDGQAVYVKKSS